MQTPTGSFWTDLGGGVPCRSLWEFLVCVAASVLFWFLCLSLGPLCR